MFYYGDLEEGMQLIQQKLKPRRKSFFSEGISCTRKRLLVMESEGRSSTGSTVSGVFKTILQSPTPICMFYFSHPFGVSSPKIKRQPECNENNGISTFETYTSRKSYSTKDNQQRNGFYYDSYQKNRKKCHQEQDGPVRLIPWPRNTWKRDFVLPPLIQFRGNRDDGLAPDLETVLRTIRQAWNSPTGISSYNIPNHKRDNFWKQFCNQDYVSKMGSGLNQNTTCPRLLKRRYSVPEIIMRKHELAQQKTYNDYTAASVPSPYNATSTGISSSNSTSSLYRRNHFTNSPGSDGNLSRGPEKEVSLRKSSLLRQMWEKEARLRQGKTSSKRQSPQKGFSTDGNDSHCDECRRLNISREDDMEPISSRFFLNGRTKQVTKPSSTESSSTLSDNSQTNSKISTQESLNGKQEQYTYNSVDTSETLGQFESDQKLEIDLSNSQNLSTGNEDNYKIDSNLEWSALEHQKEILSHESSESGDSTLDMFISKMLIENLHDLAKEARERCKRKNNIECFKIKKDIAHQSEVDTAFECCEECKAVESIPIPDNLETAQTDEKIFERSETPEKSKEDNAESTSELSSEMHLDELPSADVIQMNVGSTYPSANEEESYLVIPRVLKILPRTESIEVQPSSASIVEEENYCQHSDESLSLVDSLDDPSVLEENEELTIPPSCTKSNVEKSWAFFVPIVDSGQENMADVPVVAESMPEKLKERIEQRQLKLDAKKECSRRTQCLSEQTVSQILQSEKTLDSKPKKKKYLVPLDNRCRKKPGKDCRDLMRSEIGLLESYTVDSKGNLQYRPPQKSNCKNTNLPKNKLIKKQSILTTRPSKPTKSSSISKKSKYSPKDIQKMTIFQTQSDIITPDHENGPRRIYQKTEIQDGEKRIEILEIVECIESSDDSFPTGHIKSKCIAKSAGFRRSRIPVPICKIGRSAGSQKPIRIRECTQIFGRTSPRDPQGSSFSPKVDRAIAELLIGAISRSDQAVIEVIRSPRDALISRTSRGKIIPRRGTPKRSANSGKYRQIFEVIPEEKSSFSMDSSNEESTKDQRDSKSREQTSTNLNFPDGISSYEDTTKPIVSMTKTSIASSSNKTPNRGREAVETTEPKAWIGFFKRHECSVDEDEDITTQPYASSTTENSYQQTISSPSTDTAVQGSSTPKNTSSATFPGSSESDNILKVIEKTIFTIEENNFDESGSIDTLNNDELSKTAWDQKNFENIVRDKDCKNAKIHNDINLFPIIKPIADEKSFSHGQCHELNNVNVWRVQSPDICKRAIPKSKNSNCQEKCFDETETEIDSRSFIICSDDSTLNPSDRIDSSTTFNDLHGNVNYKKELFSKCSSCCFCNPDLHIVELVNSDLCMYCNRKKTPPKKEEETNTESDYFRKHDIYQSTSIRDHRHTMSRDSDSVSTKCTRTNKKIKRYMPDSSRASNNESFEKSKKFINRPKHVNNLPKSEKKSVNKVTQDHVKESNSQKKTQGAESKFGPFPSPYKSFSSYGYDRSSTPTSSSESTCPTTPEKQILFPNLKCRSNKSRTRKGKVASNKDVKIEDTTEGANVAAKGANSGWTVTLAGSCSQGPPPDVEMRLSFPKDQTVTNKNQPIDRSGAMKDTTHLQDFILDNNGNTRKSSALPPAIDSRQALPNNVTGGNVHKDLVFPEVGSNTPRNQLVPRHITKKAIRHLECNVAVTSATRTVSNFTRGQRTMSYQALNVDPAQKFISRERQIRDSSLDLGFLSSRRMSFESQSPLESMALSIMGNAIAPEQKPRVPTMSEKDLTRRHNRCFTRNRAFFT